MLRVTLGGLAETEAAELSVKGCHAEVPLRGRWTYRLGHDGKSDENQVAGRVHCQKMCFFCLRGLVTSLDMLTPCLVRASC